MSIEVLGSLGTVGPVCPTRVESDELHAYLSMKEIRLIQKCNWQFFKNTNRSNLQHIFNLCGYSGSDFTHLNPIYLIRTKDEITYLVAPTAEAKRRCERFINDDGSTGVEDLVNELRYNVDVVKDVENTKNEFNKRTQLLYCIIFVQK